MNFVFLTILIPIVCLSATSLPAERTVCKTKKVLIVEEVTFPISLDFISEPQEISSIVKHECDSWRIVNSLSRQKRSVTKGVTAFLEWFLSLFVKAAPSLAKAANIAIRHSPKFVATIGKSVVKHGRVVLKTGKMLGRQYSTYKKVKHILYPVKKTHFLDKKLGLFTLLPIAYDGFVNDFEIMKRLISTKRLTLTNSTSENTLTYEGFQQDISNILNNGTLGNFMKIAPDLINDLNATIGYKIPNDDFFHYVKPKNVRCDNSTSISFEIDLFEQGSEILDVESCEDIGVLNTANKYVRYIFPDMTFSNSSGEFELLRDRCKDYESFLICDISAVRRFSGCSVRQIDDCEVLEMSNDEKTTRAEQLKAPEIVNLEIPHKVTLKELFKVGDVIQIQGRTKVNSKWFSVELVDRNGGVSLYLNSQFVSKEVVLNSFLSDDWNNKEVAETFPFRNNHEFEITIKRGLYHYEISANGQHLVSFAHRSHPDKVAHIRIDGDMTLQKVILI